mgnify:CR=1 FL=1
MLFKYFCVLALFLGRFNITECSPLNSCSSQAKCIHFTVCECVLGARQVCMYWVPGDECSKSTDPYTTETVSHVCSVDSNNNNDKTDQWKAGAPICVTVVGGDEAVFGVKDGNTCSDPGTYSVSGLSTDITCNGPQNVCSGSNTKECKWIYQTESCPVVVTRQPTDSPTPEPTKQPTDSPTPEPTRQPTDLRCPLTHTCNVPLPCTYYYSPLTCPCTSYNYVNNCF